MPKQAKKNRQMETSETASGPLFSNDTVFSFAIPLTHRLFV